MLASHHSDSVCGVVELSNSSLQGKRIPLSRSIVLPYSSDAGVVPILLSIDALIILCMYGIQVAHCFHRKQSLADAVVPHSVPAQR